MRTNMLNKQLQEDDRELLEGKHVWSSHQTNEGELNARHVNMLMPSWKFTSTTRHIFQILKSTSFHKHSQIFKVRIIFVVISSAFCMKSEQGIIRTSIHRLSWRFGWRSVKLSSCSCPCLISCAWLVANLYGSSCDWRWNAVSCSPSSVVLPR